MEAKEDVWINGTLCQALTYQDSSWNPTGPSGQKTLYYHHDGEYLYHVQEKTGTKTVLYKQVHIPGDTVLFPEVWEQFGSELTAIVLDTFSVSRIYSNWFAYSIEWTCTHETWVTKDTVVVIPGFGWLPGFSQGVPFEHVPGCLSIDATYYTLSCAYIPGLGIYGEKPNCQLLADIINPPQLGTPWIFPNPASESIRINGLHPASIIRFQIVDATGHLVLKQTQTALDSIALDAIPCGYYTIIIRHTTSSPPWIGRFIKL